MPRKSRKEQSAAQAPSITTTNKVYKTAIYARLSLLDNGRHDGDTIENQVRMVMEYITESPHLIHAETYIDNGWTGTNFNRPSFNKLMDDVKKGHINCIVVKDLSRFGRNYIEVGNYLEKIFPFIGVRFISLNDSFDSADPTNFEGLGLALKSLINDIYAKDISQKVSAAFEIKQQKGEFIGNYAAYGYIKSAENKHKLAVDPETAPVIQDIFRYKLECMSNIQIARKLNERGIPSPSNYRYQKRLLKTDKYAGSLWQQQSIKSILKNPVYTGCVSQGKHKRRLSQGISPMRTDSTQWINVDGMHEAIISKDMFDEVNGILAKSKESYQAKQGKYDFLPETENLFKGIVYCSDCGSPLTRYKDVRYRQKKNPPTVCYTYICQNFEQNRTLSCKSRKLISEKLLSCVVWESIKSQIALFADLDKIAMRLKESKQYRSKLSSLNKKMASVSSSIEHINARLSGLYDDFADGILSEEDYRFAKSKYREKKAKLELRHAELAKTLNIAEDSSCSDERAEAIAKFKSSEALSRTMLLELIERIVIANKETVIITFKYCDEHGYKNRGRGGLLDVK